MGSQGLRFCLSVLGGKAEQMFGFRLYLEIGAF